MTGSLWWIDSAVHVCVPQYDSFKLTQTEGRGTRESCAQFPVAKGEYMVGDRRYSTTHSIVQVTSPGGHVLVPVNTGALLLRVSDGSRCDLLQAVNGLYYHRDVGAWSGRMIRPLRWPGESVPSTSRIP